MGNRDEFERAFAGATVHDIFNWLCVTVLLPVEVLTGYLYTLSKAVLSSFSFHQTADMKVELLSKLTKPFTKRIVQVRIMRSFWVGLLNAMFRYSVMTGGGK